MKTKFYFISLFLLTIAFSSCEKVPDDVDKNIIISEESILIFENGLEYDLESHAQTISFTTNVAWSAKSDVAWVTVSPNSGVAGSAFIVILIEENVYVEERSAVITISAGSDEKSFTIIQMGIEALITVSKEDKAIDIDSEGTFSVDVSSNTSWSTSSDAEWCTISPSKGSGNQTITISATENSTNAKRVATVTISVSDEINQTITVTQFVLGNVKLGNIIVSDRNMGAPEGGFALNYTNDEDHVDHKNVSFKGSYYTWEEAKTACPSDWRLPSKDELEVIMNAMQFSNDRAYLTDGTNMCYFPLSGSVLSPSNVYGLYWSSTKYDDIHARLLSVDANYSTDSYADISNGLSVRCVKIAD